MENNFLDKAIDLKTGKEYWLGYSENFDELIVFDDEMVLVDEGTEEELKKKYELDYSGD